MSAIEKKAGSGTDLMVALFDDWLDELGFELQTPREARLRGGHISLSHPQADRIAVAMRQYANVVPDFRRPNIIRVAVSPLYTSYEEIYTGFERLKDLVVAGQHLEVSIAKGGVT